MATKEITTILDLHGINYRLSNERIIADDSYIMAGVLHIDDLDVTDYTLKDLFIWLGY